MLPKKELIMSKEDLTMVENLKKTEDENSDTSSVISESSVQSGSSSNTDIYDICGYIGPTLVCADEADIGQSYLEVVLQHLNFFEY